jgi:uncharacterized membrane protein YhaH (DUF805 family)
MSVTDIDDNPPSAYCINCGAKAKAVAKFCHMCGLPVYRGTSSEMPSPFPIQPFLPASTPVAVEIENAAIVGRHRGLEQNGEAVYMTALDWYLEPWRKYNVFAGRARRKEFWSFLLGNLMIVFALSLSEGVFGISAESDESLLAGLFQIVVIVPSIAVSVRRMHDTDHPGWWSIIPILGYVFFCVDGTRGENRFGSDPKTATSCLLVLEGKTHG